MKTVRCPNFCFNGKDKLQDFGRAFFTLIDCKFCRGKGKIADSKTIKINKIL